MWGMHEQSGYSLVQIVRVPVMYVGDAWTRRLKPSTNSKDPSNECGGCMNKVVKA